MVCVNYRYTDKYARIERVIADVLEEKNHPCFPQIAGAQKALHLFSEHTGATLKAVQTTMESGFPEPMYVFDDSLGGYTLQGIIHSLDELQNKGIQIDWE